MPGALPAPSLPGGNLRYRHAPGVLHRRSIDAILLLRAPASDPVILTGTAVDLWECCAGGQTLDEVVDSLSRHFSESPDRIRADLQAAADTLISMGALLPG